MEAFQFDPRKKGRAYSKGNRQKVALIAALAGAGRPVHLRRADERPRPADGGRCSAREIDRIRAAGATVLLSSHILSEVEQLCDRVLDHPRRQDRRVGHARRAAPPHPHRGVVRRGRMPRPSPASRAPTTCVVEEGRVAVHRRQRRRRPASSPCSRARDVAGLRIEPPSLEELFLRHYGDDLAAAEGMPTVNGR